MAVRPGEENVATLYGDVHFFYGPPTENPPHHRFDKGSYVYLFENANERRARIEIANKVGTEDQDAFDGCECLSRTMLATRSTNTTLSQSWIRSMSHTHTDTTAW